MATTLSAQEDENVTNHPIIETFDDILIYIGATGRCQKFLVFILLPFFCASAFLLYGQIFITIIPNEYWCKVPQFDNTNLTDWQKIELSVPPNAEDINNGKSQTSYSQCKMYITNYTDLLITNRKPALDTPIAECKHEWSFNQTSIPYLSIGAELEWVCQKSYLSTTAQTSFFMGSMAGALIFGYIADTYGRLPALVICNIVGFFASIATVFCNSFWSFTIARFFVGSSFDNCYTFLFIIVIEYVEPKYRTLITNMCFGIYFASGAIMFPWIAYWISNWKILSIVAALPLTVTFITPWIIPESARWYLHKGQVKKALKVLKKIARINKQNVEPEIYEEFKRNFKTLIKEDQSRKNYTMLDLFKLPRLRYITIVLIICWLLINLIYFGYIWNMQLLYENVFVSYSTASICEFLAACIVALFLDRCGRRWLGFFSTFVSGIFSFIVLGMPIGVPAMVIAILARLGNTVTLNINYQYAAEILPTIVRAQGISLIHVVGCIIDIFGPYVVSLATIHPSLPFVLVGSLSFITAILMLTLPETTNQKLPETLEEGNDFGREQSFWLFPCVNRSSKIKQKHIRSLSKVDGGFPLITINGRLEIIE